MMPRTEPPDEAPDAHVPECEIQGGCRDEDLELEFYEMGDPDSLYGSEVYSYWVCRRCGKATTKWPI